MTLHQGDFQVDRVVSLGFFRREEPLPSFDGFSARVVGQSGEVLYHPRFHLAEQQQVGRKRLALAGHQRRE
jgi:hypothetical protein